MFVHASLQPDLGVLAEAEAMHANVLSLHSCWHPSKALACLTCTLTCLQAFYVPFAFLAIDLVTGKHWIGDALGILVGHL